MSEYRKSMVLAIEKDVRKKFRGSDLEYTDNLMGRFVDAYFMLMRQNELLRRIKQIADPEILDMIEKAEDAAIFGED